MDKYMVANLTKEYCIKHEKTMNKCQLLSTKYVKPTQKIIEDNFLQSVEITKSQIIYFRHI